MTMMIQTSMDAIHTTYPSSTDLINCHYFVDVTIGIFSILVSIGFTTFHYSLTMINFLTENVGVINSLMMVPKLLLHD